MSEAIHESALSVDLSPRFPVSTTVVGSPAAGAETVIGSVTIPAFNTLVKAAGVLVNGWAAYTIGTNGVSCRVRIRQTNIAGTVIADTGVVTGGHNTAAQLVADDILGFDSGAGVATYVLTLLVGSGTAPSTVSAVCMTAVVI